MKGIIKNVLTKPYRSIQKAVIESQDKESVYQLIQRQIVNQYHIAKINGIKPYDPVNEAGFRCYSEYEEDGIILYILSMIGFKTKKVVEMCCGNGSECMATNLILNHGFDGYLFDGNESNV